MCMYKYKIGSLEEKKTESKRRNSLPSLYQAFVVQHCDINFISNIILSKVFIYFEEIALLSKSLFIFLLAFNIK